MLLLIRVAVRFDIRDYCLYEFIRESCGFLRYSSGMCFIIIIVYKKKYKILKRTFGDRTSVLTIFFSLHNETFIKI